MSLRGTNQEFGRPYNRRIVLEFVRLEGPTTRSRIAEQVGLTVQTVSTIIRELEELGFILSEREEPRGRGNPPTTLRINPAGGYAVGIHVTPLGLKAGLMNLAGDVVADSSRDVADTSPDVAFSIIAEMVGELAAERPGGRILGVGLALPGPFDVDSMSFVGPTTMRGWAHVPLVERLTAVTGLPSFIEVDMAAAALGERLYGLGARYSEFYYLYFGVGLGGAMIHDGAVLRGAWGNAGEIGHIPLVPGGELCACGNRGCLERYVSVDAFGRNGAGSPAAWARDVAPIFASAITTIENLFDPQTIVLGGFTTPAIVDALAETVGELPNSVSARQGRTVPRVMVSTAGRHAVLRGAAALAVAGVLSPRFGQLFAERAPLSNKGLAA